ncbi:hypothetical protein [Oceanispirochaeta sp.]|jgi:NitT/TauT family transport system substrate-binding protein|uniref:ABC transporter substrate-binding protein n=1 Tax=Oceanispirochaeta sp. TaxID=2035350 RepID=UPI00260DCA3A|nr:hypothetical protein [Oceanispirochaeta sp.]MDA3956752.1 hypothetical protein [Oceanispirochaeta sp.]
MKKLGILILALTALYAAGATGQREFTEQEKAIRIGVMPDAGALPLFLMENVELVPFMSAKERDTAMQVGELDGTMTDLVSVVSFGQKGMPQRVLTITESRFMIVVHPEFNIEDSWSIGLSDNTVIEFMVDQLTRGRQIEKVSIPQVPVRMEMLGNGKIPMACLTDAMAWPLLSRGFPIVKDQADTALEPAVLAFRESYIQEHPEELAAFKDQWNAAVEKINSDPDQYSSLLLEKIRLPDDPEHPYPVPHYRSIMLPPEGTVDAVLQWFDGKYGLEHPVSSVDLLIP